MAEWFNASVLKTDVPKGTGGSNPSLSAAFGSMMKSVNIFDLKSNANRLLGASPSGATNFLFFLINLQCGFNTHLRMLGTANDNLYMAGIYRRC